MEQIRISELFAKLKPFVLDVISTVGGGTGPFAPSPHDLSSGHHTGSISDAQAPQFLKADGSRMLIGNLTAADGITIDGVDLSAFRGAYDTHAGLDAAAAHGSVGLHSHQNNPGGGLLDHGLALSGLGDDDHAQYAHSDGSGTRRAYEAGRLNRSVIAGAGLTGGGLLTADRTLDVGAGAGIAVSADAVAVDTAAAFTWMGLHTFQNTLTTRHVLPELTDTYDLGSSIRLWRKGWLSELDAVLFAQNTVTLLGGWLLITKDEGAIDADVTGGATQINFGRVMTTGDFVLFRAALKVEYMQVGTLVSGTTYNVTRNLDGSGADTWPAGTPFAVLGASGQGRIELNAFDTPRLQMIRQGATFNAQTELIRLGDLNGNWDYTSQKWGLAIGDFAAGRPNITIDEDGVLRFRLHTTEVMRFGGGNADITGLLRMSGTASAITIGATPPTGSSAGTGIWIDRTGLYSLVIGVHRIKIDAVTGDLIAGGGNVIIGQGIKLIEQASYDGSAAITFRTIGDSVITKMWGSSTAGTRSLELETINPNGSSEVNFKSQATGSESSFRLSNTRTDTNEEMIVELRSLSATPWIRIGTNHAGSTTNFIVERGAISILRDGDSSNIRRWMVTKEGFTIISSVITVKATRITAQSISNNTWTAVNFSQAILDQRPSGLSAQWESGQPTRLTCRVAGTYYIYGNVMFASNATGNRMAAIRLNGGQFLLADGRASVNGLDTIINLSGTLNLNVNDYIELMVFQSSGGALNIVHDTGNLHSPVLAMTRMP